MLKALFKGVDIISSCDGAWPTRILIEIGEARSWRKTLTWRRRARLDEHSDTMTGTSLLCGRVVCCIHVFIDLMVAERIDHFK